MTPELPLPRLVLLPLWAAMGLLAGIALVPLARRIPARRLERTGASPEGWIGPGGGIAAPVPPARKIWVPVAAALLSVRCAWIAATPQEALALALFSGTLLLLALIDWDTTMLPNAVVLPLGAGGLLSSHLGLTGQGLAAAAASAALAAGFVGGLGELYRRFRGETGVGGGDIKLLGTLGAWLGLYGVLYVVVWAGLGTALWFLMWRRLGKIDRAADWPFGPAIAVAALFRMMAL
ncbi:A24 family peptidase [Chlorobium sp. N1]|uniref:prepilin peptidase n=1 Tax=Chlorobium sp. N1 TaxID=2491138 RepID=UPI00103CA407|nr:A24 family peptidase [Chlorobium sp. N1]TCD47222.1 prepilin peptidase [Chlorobium sp. N1]